MVGAAGGGSGARDAAAAEMLRHLTHAALRGGRGGRWGERGDKGRDGRQRSTGGGRRTRMLPSSPIKSLVAFDLMDPRLGDRIAPCVVEPTRERIGPCPAKACHDSSHKASRLVPQLVPQPVRGAGWRLAPLRARGPRCCRPSRLSKTHLAKDGHDVLAALVAHEIRENRNTVESFFRAIHMQPDSGKTTQTETHQLPQVSLCPARDLSSQRRAVAKGWI